MPEKLQPRSQDQMCQTLPETSCQGTIGCIPNVGSLWEIPIKNPILRGYWWVKKIPRISREHNRFSLLSLDPVDWKVGKTPPKTYGWEGPQMMGRKEKVAPFKDGQFLVSMLNFWGFSFCFFLVLITLDVCYDLSSFLLPGFFCGVLVAELLLLFWQTSNFCWKWHNKLFFVKNIPILALRECIFVNFQDSFLINQQYLQ